MGKEKKWGEGTSKMTEEQGFCRPNRNVYERVVCSCKWGRILDAAGMEKTRKVDARGPDAERPARETEDPEIISTHVTWNQRGKLNPESGTAPLGAGAGSLIGFVDVDSLKDTQAIGN